MLEGQGVAAPRAAGQNLLVSQPYMDGQQQGEMPAPPPPHSVRAPCRVTPPPPSPTEPYVACVLCGQDLMYLSNPLPPWSNR